MTEDALTAIHQELVLSYTQAGRVVPTTVDVMARSLEDSLHFSDAAEVHRVFKKARMVADVPTQRVLKDCMDSVRQEVPQAIGVDRKQIEGVDSREAWLPRNPLLQKINLAEAIKRLCIAQGIDQYRELIRTHVTKYEMHVDRKVTVYVTPDAARNFDEAMTEYLMRLYKKYLLKTDMYKDFPKNGELDPHLQPPEVYEFKEFLAFDKTDTTTRG